MTTIRLSKFIINEGRNAFEVFVDIKPITNMSDCCDYMTALILTCNGYCNVAGVIVRYEDGLLKGADVIYNITRDYTINPKTERDLNITKEGDYVLMIYLRESYPRLCFYHQKHVLPKVERIDEDTFKIRSSLEEEDLKLAFDF